MRPACTEASSGRGSTGIRPTRSRSNRLKPDDFAGGTYTLSNSGTFGTLITAPIINQPQVAILSTDGVRKKPVVVETSEGDSIAILIGPEGGWTEDERASFSESSWTRVTMGPLILRAETAAIAALSIAGSAWLAK